MSLFMPAGRDAGLCKPLFQTRPWPAVTIMLNVAVPMISPSLAAVFPPEAGAESPCTSFMIPGIQ